MDRFAHEAGRFEEARRFEIERYRAMPTSAAPSPKALRDRDDGTRCPDVRDAVAGLRRRRAT